MKKRILLLLVVLPFTAFAKKADREDAPEKYFWVGTLNENSNRNDGVAAETDFLWEDKEMLTLMDYGIAIRIEHAMPNDYTVIFSWVPQVSESIIATATLQGGDHSVTATYVEEKEPDLTEQALPTYAPNCWIYYNSYEQGDYLEIWFVEVAGDLMASSAANEDFALMLTYQDGTETTFSISGEQWSSFYRDHVLALEPTIDD